MTAPRRPRSAWLLVGSTPSVWVKVQSAGQRLSRFLAKSRWYLVRGLLRARRVRKFGHPDLQGNPCGRSAGSTLRSATPVEQNERHDPGSAGGRVRKSVAKPGTDLIDARAREPRERLARLAATRPGF